MKGFMKEHLIDLSVLENSEVAILQQSGDFSCFILPTPKLIHNKFKFILKINILNVIFIFVFLISSFRLSLYSN